MAKAIMVQGTMSNVGKSLLAAGLCRIFKQDGYRVAPFKSQNMALNSFVTADGREMSRAQAMQAEAAGIEPMACMNPILLKPAGDAGSHVIVNGEEKGRMDARAYYGFKQQLRPVVQQAYNALDEGFDIVVLEGAGSPAEINLNRDDFVNMGMARMANAPVLLVGDINPGGIFAQLYGTVQLFSEQERQMVKGLCINKFRGDESILRPGLRPLEELCGAPVLGVVPYMQLDLEDEDSLSSRLHRPGGENTLDVAVVHLPHLANFTDFDALERHPHIGLRYVKEACRLGRPDLLLLPGTQHVMQDLRWLHASGFAACTSALALGGTPTIGIGGGYQMLGALLQDPEGAQGGGEVEGLGLLPARTVLTKEKKRGRASGVLCPREGWFVPLAGLALQGYEIRTGNTGGGCPPACRLSGGAGERQEGGAQGNVLGTCLHGFFDAPGVVDALADRLLLARGLPAGQAQLPSAAQHKESQFDLLAGTLRRALDMPRLYQILEAGI